MHLVLGFGYGEISAVFGEIHSRLHRHCMVSILFNDIMCILVGCPVTSAQNNVYLVVFVDSFVLLSSLVKLIIHISDYFFTPTN